MNNLQIFKHSEFGEIGVITIDGREYFPATACAKILGYANPHDAIRKHCRCLAKREVPHPQSHGKIIEVNFIPEGDIYRLITHSKLPTAEKFERWVFDEVLPSIRKHGYYSTRNELPMDKVMEIVQMTMSATVAEVIRQLVPAMTPSAQVTAAQGQPTFTFTMTSPQPQSMPFQKQRRRSAGMQGKIERLDPEMRQKVDNMISSKQYTYQEISDWLKAMGHDISHGAVGRYYQHFKYKFEL